jgi:excisionase family DNA binding protein
MAARVKGNGEGEARKFYSTAEVTEKLGLTRRTIQKWLKDGRLPHYRFGQGKGASIGSSRKILRHFYSCIGRVGCQRFNGAVNLFVPMPSGGVEVGGRLRALPLHGHGCARHPRQI